MNRCFLLGLAAFAANAFAQTDGGADNDRRNSSIVLSAPADASVSTAVQVGRSFPQKALRGAFMVLAAPEISLNGVVERLSPGARIRSEGNTLVSPATIAGQNLLVNYTRELSGLIHEVWILTPEEASIRRATKPSAQQAGAPHDDGKTPYDQLPKWSR